MQGYRDDVYLMKTSAHHNTTTGKDTPYQKTVQITRERPNLLI